MSQPFMLNVENMTIIIQLSAIIALPVHEYRSERKRNSFVKNYSGIPASVLTKFLP